MKKSPKLYDKPKISGKITEESNGEEESVSSPDFNSMQKLRLTEKFQDRKRSLEFSSIEK